MARWKTSIVYESDEQIEHDNWMLTAKLSKGLWVKVRTECIDLGAPIPEELPDAEKIIRYGKATDAILEIMMTSPPVDELNSEDRAALKAYHGILKILIGRA